LDYLLVWYLVRLQSPICGHEIALARDDVTVSSASPRPRFDRVTGGIGVVNPATGSFLLGPALRWPLC